MGMLFPFLSLTHERTGVHGELPGPFVLSMRLSLPPVRDACSYQRRRALSPNVARVANPRPVIDQLVSHAPS